MLNYISSLYPTTTTTLSQPPLAIYPPAVTVPSLYYGDISRFPVNATTVAGAQNVHHDDLTRIKLSRDDLLKFSSQEYDDYVKSVSLKRPLTEKEHKESKKQRRLIKNREYAQISRNKKKTEYTQLSIQIDHLNQYNSELIERVNQLETDNKRLKEENQKLIQTLYSSSYSSSSHSQPPSDSYSSDEPTNPTSSSSPSPPLYQSPPLTPPSSEDSSSFDLFPEDTDGLFSSDWSSSINYKYTFMAIFCCLLLSFLPLSSLDYPVMPKSTTMIIPSTPSPIQYDPVENRPSSFGYSRNLLKVNPNDVYSFNSEPSVSGNVSSKGGFITIEDVLNDELNGIGLVSIKNHGLNSENGTLAVPLVISNRIPYYYPQ
jgi:hypothetical protein